MATLVATGLSSGYRGRAVLHDIDLDLRAGLHLVLGPNGAGKTTLFRTLAGVLPPLAGRVLVDGRDPAVDVPARALVGVSTHRVALAPRLSVVENLSYWARILALPAPDRAARVEGLVDLLELGPIGGQRAGTLSRGQAQRVSLARALLADPPVLLLDEPFSGVDPAVGVQLRGHLRALAERGHTLVVSTHELAEAAEMGGDVTVLQAGRVVGQGATPALRAAVVGDGYRLRLRASGDLVGTLTNLGYRPDPASGDSVMVEVPNDEAVEAIVAALVAAGVGVREVAPAANPLEDLYLRLMDEGARADAR
jgi:ABC-2 type transport system ATP-binding protein